MGQTKSVGIRQLRQNLSVYISRVRKGERYQVTERGVPVAVLGPISGSHGTLDRLAAQGLVQRASRDPASLGPPPSPHKKPKMSASKALAQLRADDR
ncbi:MAG: type II toxin-antitoxin system Phd/YefM family antitoxin [Actinomycetota bacterium]